MGLNGTSNGKARRRGPGKQGLSKGNRAVELIARAEGSVGGSKGLNGCRDSMVLVSGFAVGG